MRDAQKITDELESRVFDSNMPLERRLADVFKWYYYSRDRIPMDNMQGWREFTDKYNLVVIELMAMLLDRADKRNKSEKLWLPSGISVDGRKYG